MGIGAYIRRIGRKRGDGRALTRAEAADLMGQVLDQTASDFEIGAFCMAMRMKGETVDEFAGFLDALHARTQRVCCVDGTPVVVIPSYNGARKYPVLTPLLGLLLAARGMPVLMHGMASEDVRVTSGQVFQHLGIAPDVSMAPLSAGELRWVPTAALCPGLARLIEVRRALTMRNTGHSLAKMLNPVQGKALLLSSYTHGEYSEAMQAAFETQGTQALLFNGLEGEVVALENRGPAKAHETDDIGAAATAELTQAVLQGKTPAPAELAAQIDTILSAWQALP